MASTAQVEANRRNAQKSTGPRTEAGKARTRLNALRSGAYARTVTPVLPHEDPRELDGRIRQWIDDLEPQNAVERELVGRAARLSWVLERAERYETAHLARRIRKAQLNRSSRRMQQVCDLGRKLLYNPGPKVLASSRRPWDDNPAAFLRGLEESAEGCQWLLERWRELQHVTIRSVEWTKADMFKLIRLQGKVPIEAINDPTLNAIFLAWDTIFPGTAQKFWSACKECKPLDDPGFSDFMRWREIADRPADAAHAVLFLTNLIDEQIERIEEMLALHEEIAGDEMAELADRASFENSASFERLRRFQSSKSRELKQTLDALHLLRNGRTKTDDGGCRTSNGKCQTTGGRCQTRDEESSTADHRGQKMPGEEEPRFLTASAVHEDLRPRQRGACQDSSCGPRRRAASRPVDSLNLMLAQRLMGVAFDNSSDNSVPRSPGADRGVPARSDPEKAVPQVTRDTVNARIEANQKSPQADTGQSVNDCITTASDLKPSQRYGSSSSVQCPGGELTERQMK
jgi:hypothetical protein